jgi:hypothetical protein
MTRSITVDPYGNFTVSDDPDATIATALLVAGAPQNAPLVATALAPGGEGLRVRGIGAIDRLVAREELPPPYDDDPTVDPETQELWSLFREPDARNRLPGQVVLSGDELRELVERALALRAK